MPVGPEDEFLERRRRQRAPGTTVREAGVAEGGGGVDADEEEEGLAQEEVERGLGVDVRQHPVFPPAFGDEVEQGVDRGEGQPAGPLLIRDGGEETADVIGVFGEGCRWVLGEVEAEEVVVLDEVFGDGMLAGADA